MILKLILDSSLSHIYSGNISELLEPTHFNGFLKNIFIIITLKFFNIFSFESIVICFYPANVYEVK